MMDIAIRAAARPGQRRLVCLCAAVAGVAAGVAAGLVIGLATRVPGRIPADARVVTVTPVFDFGSGPSRGEPADAVTITDPATVAKIAAVIHGLRQLPDATYSCPAAARAAMMLTAMQLTTPGTRHQAQMLLDGLNILCLEKTERDGHAFSGPKHWHTFDILVRKPVSKHPSAPASR